MKLLDWIFDHPFVALAIGISISVVVTLLIYHDPRCLVARCWIVKH